MGFNNAGAAQLATNLAKIGDIGVPLGISLGKSKVTPVDNAVGDYLTSLRAVYPLRRLHRGQCLQSRTPRACAGCRTGEPLDELLGALTSEAGSLAWRRAGTMIRCRCW